MESDELKIYFLYFKDFLFLSCLDLMDTLCQEMEPLASHRGVMGRWKASYQAQKENLPNGLLLAIFGQFQAIELKMGLFLTQMAQFQANNFAKSTKTAHYRKLGIPTDLIVGMREKSVPGHTENQSMRLFYDIYLSKK